MGCLVELFLMTKGVVEKCDEVVRRVLRERWGGRERAQRVPAQACVCEEEVTAGQSREQWSPDPTVGVQGHLHCVSKAVSD